MKSNKSSKKWNEESKNFINDVWGDMTIDTIARRTNRSKQAVIAFAQKNKLGGFLYTGNYLTTVETAEIIGVDYTTIISWIKKGILKAQFRKINKKKIYLIDPKDFKIFLKENQDKWKYEKFKNCLFNEKEKWLQEKKKADEADLFFKTGEVWTTNEEEYMLDLIKQGYTNTQISKILNRTKESVERRRSCFLESNRLERDQQQIKNKKNKKFILDNWGKMSIEELAERTDKTREQIIQYKWKYNLPSLYNLEEDYFSFIEIGKILEVSRDTIRRWVNLGLSAEVKNKGNKKRYAININNIMPFLETNRDRITEDTYIRCKSILEERLKK